LGLKIGTHPTALLSLAAAGIQAGLAALSAGRAEAPGALTPEQLRTTLGYPDYDRAARPFFAGS
jgi:hypothetical protein